MKVEQMRELLARPNDEARLKLIRNRPVAFIKSQPEKPAYKPKYLNNLYPHFYLE